jgi:hypothetical protein
MRVLAMPDAAECPGGVLFVEKGPNPSDENSAVVVTYQVGRNACNEDGDLQLILDTSADNPRSLLAHTNEKIHTFSKIHTFPTA